jgi:AcrR family transcriptional regulator
MRRQHILDCALPIFGEHGFHDTSMNDIAHAAGITKPVIYQHFASKRDLYSALITELGEEMIAAVTQATGNAIDGKMQTQQGFHAYFTWVDRHQDGFRVLFGGAAQRDNEFASHLRQVRSGIANAVASMIVADIDPEEQSLIAHAITGLAEGASRRLIENNLEFDPDEVATAMSALAWAGLRALTPTSS